MNRRLLPILFALFCCSSTFAGESLLDILKKRSLDLGMSNETTVAGAFSELNELYRAKYGESLPIFISLELLQPKGKPAAPPAGIPGLQDPGAVAGPAPSTRIGGRLNNVPLLDVVKYYANMVDAAYTIGPDTILIHKPK